MTDVVSTGAACQQCWTYWVAYQHSGGCGAVAVSLGLPLRAACQLLMLARRIERDEDVRDVVVLSWQELLGPPAGVTQRPEGLAGADDVSVPELALRELLAAGRRLDNRVSSVAFSLLDAATEMAVHLERPTPVAEAGGLLAELGFAGEPRIREHRGDNPFVVCSGAVDVAGCPVIVKVFCEVSA